MDDTEAKIVFWHRELPPLEADLVGEHTVEASSSRVPGTLAHRDELWDRCYRDLVANTQNRLVQEVTRLGGHLRTSTTKQSIQDTTTRLVRRGTTAVSVTCCTGACRHRHKRPTAGKPVTASAIAATSEPHLRAHAATSLD